MNSSRFEKRQLRLLASLINCSPAEILFLCANAESYYSKRVELKTNKETGKIKTYSDGTPKQRIIRPSYTRLKQIQRSIKINILSKVPLPKNIKGGVKGYSNIDNAKEHKGNKYKFSTDLQDFFPSISFKMIYSMFLRIGYTHHIAHWLTKLTSIDFELPQGARTSTHIANLVFLPVDYILIDYCKAHGIVYTRWIDDLSFSSQKDFQDCIQTFLSAILDNGFKISWRKTIYKANQNMTGIDVYNNYINVPNKLIKKFKKEKLDGKDTEPLQRYINSIRSQNPKAKTKEQQKKDFGKI